MKNIKKVIVKIFTKDVILYVIFGILTTIVNIVSFTFMNIILKWEVNSSNFISIILSILVAYITNRKLVFHSKASTLKQKVIEFIKFFIGRVFTLTIEFICGLFLFNLPIPHIIIKSIITVFIIIINFFISKFYAFKDNR